MRKLKTALLPQLISIMCTTPFHIRQKHRTITIHITIHKLLLKPKKASKLCGGIGILMHVSKALLLLHITNNSFSTSMEKPHHSTPYQYPPLLLHIISPTCFGPQFTVREFILIYNKGKCQRF